MTPPNEAAGIRNRTTFSTPSDHELVITRTFDAPRSLVWAAFTDPKHLPNWHTGPKGTTMPLCEIDLRPGGSWRYLWRSAQGHENEAAGIYREVDPPRRLVQVTNRGGAEQTNTTTFSEDNGRTTVVVSIRFASKAARDQALPYAKGGTASSYAHLDAYLASMR